ncbi:UNVERIFIED_CONTAM: hypothetical protein FKN15_074633 [Acipenser sinensis]
MGKRRHKSQLFNSLTKKQKHSNPSQSPIGLGLQQSEVLYGSFSLYMCVVVCSGEDGVNEEATHIVELPDSLDQSSAESDVESEPERVSAYQKLLSTLNSPSEEEEESEGEDGSDEGEDPEVEEQSEQEVEGGDGEDEESEGGEVENGIPGQEAEEEDGDEDEEVGIPGEEFTDKEHESKFSLETNILGEEEEEEEEESANTGERISQDLFVQHLSTELNEEDVKSITTKDKTRTHVKVLILVPFRDSAMRVVQTLISLLEVGDRKLDVSNKKRFKDEFGSGPENQPANLSRPDDYHAVFSGNVDDHFRIGVSILQKSMRLYSPFYSSDIIVASPLGLRTVLGVEGDKKREFDFLSSIELLIIDQADVFLMQNWEHVLHVMKHLNLQPLDSHGVDFSRVRMWNLNNWSRYYRQTLLFSAIQDPQINAIHSKHCCNYRGQVAVKNLPKTGSISQVLVQLPHIFQRLEADSFMDQDARFQFFVDKVLPQYRDAVMSHTLIYIPSYFDYVRLRNYLRKEELNCTHICEYSKKSEVSRARHFFQTGDKQFLLFTERFHFYKRYTIKGICNLIFYALPTYPHFYSEMCNMLKASSSGEEATWTCTALYSRYDMQRLAAIAGAERAAQMLQSKKSVHLYTIKGICNLIFYALPTYPHFYSEMCNMLKASSSGEEATWTCTALYSRYDMQRLAAIAGAERAAQMLQSKKSVHLFVTGGEETL